MTRDTPLVLVQNIRYSKDILFDVKARLISGDPEVYNTPSGFAARKGCYVKRESFKLASKIWKLDGIEEIKITRHSVKITVGRAFSMNSLHRPITAMITEYLTKKESDEKQAVTLVESMIQVNKMKFKS